MEEKREHSRFNGSAWFDRQVQRRTRAALTERGSSASTRSREYKTEYERQLQIFRAERKEKKRHKREIYLARLERQKAAKQAWSEMRGA